MLQYCRSIKNGHLKKGALTSEYFIQSWKGVWDIHTVCSDSHLIYSISLTESMCFKSQHILWELSSFTTQRRAVISQEAMHNKSVRLECAQFSALFPCPFCITLNLKWDQENKSPEASCAMTYSTLLLLWRVCRDTEVSRNVFTRTLSGHMDTPCVSENGWV